MAGAMTGAVPGSASVWFSNEAMSAAVVCTLPQYTPSGVGVVPVKA